MIKKSNASKLCTYLLALASISTFALSALPVQAETTTDNLKDISSDHWAYNAVKELVDKYNVMSGFPDKTFRGTKTFTRYEAAAALYKVMLRVEELMGNQPKNITTVNPKVSSEDLKTLKDLTDEFRRELDAMKASNATEYAKIKSVEDDLAKVKVDFGKLRFGGKFEAGFDDTLEDTYRPAYYSNYRLDMRANINDSTSVNSRFAGSFSSEVQEKVDNGVKKKSDNEVAALNFAQAWFNYAPANTFLNPKVKFGYMSLGKLIDAGTSVPSYFSGSTDNAGPDLNSGGKKRGLRISKTVSAGVEVGNGPFALTLAATPQTFAAQAKADFGFLKVKLLADADQTLFIGEIVQDPIHNEAIIVDLGNDNLGASVQANFRGVADDFQWRAASGTLHINLFNFELGGVGKFENESSQQIIAGAYIKTPDKFGTVNIPSLTFSLQEPLTLLSGTVYEGSNLGDKAGFNISVGYDNPFLPNLSVYFDQKSNVLFSSDPKDTIASSYGISTSIDF